MEKNNEVIDENEMEIPGSLIANLMKWLRIHGHTEKEVLECIYYICSDGEELPARWNDKEERKNNE